jgi:integrase
MGSKRGRKAQHYTTTWDEPIYGLARRPSDGRWRVIATGYTFTEADERLAVHRFRTPTAGQQGETIRIPFAAADGTDAAIAEGIARAAATLAGPSREQPAPVDQEFPPMTVQPGTGPSTGPIRLEQVEGTRAIEIYRQGAPHAADAFWPWLRRLILDTPALVAERTGIEQIGYLAHLPRPRPSPTLAAVGTLYHEKAAVTPHERAKSKLFWQEFVEAVGVTTLRELTAERVAGYLDDVLSADNSRTYAKHRFGKVKTIISFARKRGLDAGDCRAALDACAVLVPPRPVPLDPHPIDPGDFAKLLAAGDDQERAVLLLALNAALYGAEVAAARWPDLDLDGKTFVADRGKTGVIRVAVLWDRTVAALRKLPRKIESPFVAYQGNPHNANTMNKLFRDLRTRAGVDAEVKFADVRDGAYTAAAQAPGVQFETVRILAGHRVGMSDHYVKRRPDIVTDACRAIERSYFPVAPAAE